MNFFRWLSTETSALQTAAAAGSFVALMVTKVGSWKQVVVLFVVGQLTAFYFTVPIARDWLDFDMSAYGWIGFLIGATAMLVWGGVMSLFKSLADDPKETLQWLRELWKGKDR
jgi:hypothetical protein